MHRKAAVVFAMAVTAIVLWVAFGRRTSQPVSSEGVAARSALLPVETLTVRQTSIPVFTDVSGSVHSQLEATLGARAAGRVVSVRVREGDVVRRGQVLVLLDARDLDAAVAQANANVRFARVGLDTAQTTAGMESSLSRARISEARALVSESDAALRAASARLDQVQVGPRKQERAQASLAVTQAKANLDLAEANLHRMEGLVAQGAISRQQYDIVRTQSNVAQAQYDTAVQALSLSEEGSRAEEIRAAREAVRQAQAGLERAQAGLRQAQANALQVNVRRQETRGADARIGQAEAALRIARVARDYTAVTAPFDGVVAARLVDPGTLASPGTPLLRVLGGPLRLEAVVPESAMHSVRKGMELPVTVDAIGGERLTGRVDDIVPQGDPASHTFAVRVRIPNGRVMAGMYGRARIAVGVDRGIRVPSGAILERQGLHYVYVVGDDGTARNRLVTVGDADGGVTPVLSGLSAGERIVARNVDRMRDGMAVMSQSEPLRQARW